MANWESGSTRRGNKMIESLPQIDIFQIAGLEEGRAKGKPHLIADANIDHVWEAAQELRDYCNYIQGRLDRTKPDKAREQERARLLATLQMVKTAYRILADARECQRRGS